MGMFISGSSTSTGSFHELHITDKIGIGTTGPSQKLEVAGAALINNGTSTHNLYLGNTSYGINVVHSSGVMNFVSNDSTRFQIKNGGDVNVIGWVEGNGQNALFSSTSTGLLLQAPSTNEKIFFRDLNGNVGMTYDAANKRLGIGTSVPNRALTVSGSDFTSTSINLRRSDSGTHNDSAVVFQAKSTAATGVALGGFWFLNAVDDTANAIFRVRTDNNAGTTGRFEFVTGTGLGNNSTPVMVIKGDGDVGIGTTTPAMKLDVAGATKQQLYTAYYHTDHSTLAGYVGPAAGLSSEASNDLMVRAANDFHIGTNNSGTVRFTVLSSGNVGIGAESPVAKFQIGKSSATGLHDIRIENSSGVTKIGVAGGGSDIVSTSAAGDFIISNTETTKKILFGSGTTEKMHIDSAGVDITGTLSITGYSDVASAITSLTSGGISKSGTPVDNQVAVFTSANQVEGSSNLTFASNLLTVGGDITATGTITAQEFKTEFVSSSIVFESGSTIFGNSSDDTHAFTGNVNISSGNVTLENNKVISFEDSGGSARGIFRLNSSNRTAIGDATSGEVISVVGGRVGIGSTSPHANSKLNVENTSGVAMIYISSAANNDTALVFEESSTAKFMMGHDYSNAGKFTISDGNGFASGTLLTLDSSGNLYVVGDASIGTTATYGDLTVGGTGEIIALRATSGAAKLSFYEAGTTRAILETLNDSAGGLVVKTPSSAAVTFGNALNTSHRPLVQNGYIKLMDDDGATQAGYIGSGNDLAFGDANDLCIRGTDSIKFTANDGNADAMTINSSGNVGIGTITAPAERLHIQDSIDTNLILESTGASSTPTLHIKSPSNRAGVIKFHEGGALKTSIFHATDDSLNFYLNSGNDATLQLNSDKSIRMYGRVQVDGNLGVNCSNPQQPLTVDVGSYRIHTQMISGEPGILATDDSNSPTDLVLKGYKAKLFGAAGTGMIVDNNSDVTFTSAHIAQIDGSPELLFGTTSATHYNWRIAVQESLDTAFEIAVGEQGAGTAVASNTFTNRFLITADGKVGINGTPQHVGLDVSAGHISVDTAYSMKFDGPTGGDSISSPSANTLQLMTGGAVSMKVNNTGVAIGRDNSFTPESALDVSGSHQYGQLQIRDGSGNISRRFFISSSGAYGNGVMHIQNRAFPGGGTGQVYTHFKSSVSAGTNIHNILVDGSIGIGTTSPAYKLHISSSDHLTMQFDRAGQETYRLSHGTSGLFFTKPNSTGVAYGVTQDGDFHTFNAAGNAMFRSDASNSNVDIGYGNLSIGNLKGDSITTNTELAIYGGEGGDAILQLLADNADNTADYFAIRQLASGNLTMGHHTGGGFNDALVIGPYTGGNKVGIGTSSPSHKLSVSGPIAIDGQNTVHDTSAMVLSQESSAKSQMRIYGADSSTRGELEIKQSYNDGNGTLTTLYLNSSGNVGIGTTSPGSSLDVAGEIRGQKFAFNDDTDTSIDTFSANQIGFTLGGSSSVRWAFVAGAVAQQYMYGSSATYPSYTFVSDQDTGMFNAAANSLGFSTGGNNRLTINSSGNIIIAHTAPAGMANSSYKQIALNNGAVIADSGGTNSAFQLLQNAYVGASNSNYYTGDSKASRIMMTTGDISFATAGTGTADNQITWNTRMHIEESTGNVGIGLQTPGYDLEIQGGLGGGDLSLITSDTAITDGDVFGTIYFGARDSDFGAAVGAKIVGKSKFTWGDHGGGANDSPGELHFFTQADGAGDSFGSPRMVIGYTGNVGIGDTSPGAILDVDNSNSTSTTVMHLTDSGGTGGHTMLQMNNTGGSVAQFNITGNDLQINATADLVLQNSGANVGIGTTTPDYPLEVEGATGNTVAKFGQNMALYMIHNSPVVGFNLYYDSGYKFGESSSNSYGGYLGFSTGAGGFDFATSNTGNAGGAATMTKRVHISNAGHVGIGTDNPTGQTGCGSLHIFGNSLSNNTILKVEQDGALSSALIQIDSAADRDSSIFFQENGTNKCFIGNDASANALVLSDGSGNLNNLMYLYNGNVGISDSSPSRKLDVNGTGRFTAAVDFNNNIHLASGYNLYLDGGSNTYIKENGADTMTFTTAGSERIRINSGGNVGIGNTEPKVRLHVQNDANGISTPLRLVNTNANVADRGTAIQLGQGNNGDYTAQIAAIMENGSPSYLNPSLRFYTMNNANAASSLVERMRIRSNGRIHMGDISGVPDNGHAVMITGTLHVSSVIRSANDVVAYYSSDERLKKNIKTIENPIEKVKKLRGVEYEWNDKQDIYEEGTKDSGIIAQDVKEVLPQLVKEREDGHLGVRHDRLVGLLIESVKEQQKQIEELKSEIQELKDGSSK